MTTTEQKGIAKVSNLKFTNDFPGLSGVNIMASQYPIEPFLVFTEYKMTNAVFGPHPHAGVSVMTYMLPDSNNSFINRDSLGDQSIIEPGGLHITQAGSGMFHDEFPKTSGVVAHGFQIWINHTKQNRFVAPTSFHAGANEIPEMITHDYKVRILHGRFGNQQAKHTMVTDVKLLHIFLQPKSSIQLSANEMAFVYGLNGSGVANTEKIGAQALVNYSRTGNSVIIEASEIGFEFMFATGTPLKEQITYGGPFVMTTPEQMAITKRRHANGEMGTLKPYQS
jgi:quercetin 2,3-dioxygenase